MPKLNIQQQVTTGHWAAVRKKKNQQLSNYTPSAPDKKRSLYRRKQRLNFRFFLYVSGQNEYSASLAQPIHQPVLARMLHNKTHLSRNSSDVCSERCIFLLITVGIVWSKNLPPIPPSQNIQFDLIIRDMVRYFLLSPKERSLYLFTCYKSQAMRKTCIWRRRSQIAFHCS